MPRHTLVLVLAALLAAPLALASDTYTATLLAGYPVEGMPAGVVAQNSHGYAVALAPGDTVAVSLRWVPAMEQNDLDLVLLWPSAAPVPLGVPPESPEAGLATAQAFAGSRVARGTCADMAAKSTAHAGTSEAFTFTVPAGGESGAYVLNVRGFLLLTDQTYTLSVGVSRDGAPVAGAVTPDAEASAFLSTSPYCQLA